MQKLRCVHPLPLPPPPPPLTLTRVVRGGERALENVPRSEISRSVAAFAISKIFSVGRGIYRTHAYKPAYKTRLQDSTRPTLARPTPARPTPRLQEPAPQDPRPHLQDHAYNTHKIHAYQTKTYKTCKTHASTFDVTSDSPSTRIDTPTHHNSVFFVCP